MNKICFSKKSPEEIIFRNKSAILHFFNSHDIWWANNSQIFLGGLKRNKNYIFPDGKVISIKLGMPQQRGSSFTKRFLNSDHVKDKKHFFLVPNRRYIEEILKKANVKKINTEFKILSYIDGIEFPRKEIQGISKSIKSFEPDFVWICIGCPKQNILSSTLYEKHNAFYLNVGAGIDFLIGRKTESPKIFTSMGLEWLYRLITDFNHTKKKAWRSFVATKYLFKRVELKK